ncbi:coniferyl-alcohol dehydrogenase [Rhizobacter sp. Root1221]|uniref:coniferyl-alcohol dehydrogenase n=1 Tax=Rhizobacter sp. Root1221 TaxID=1736433 RepID=UPI0006FB7345|nr:coniferyl-alcohol dehydrogenase [Rhizobacter sp. Root1221]KQV99340.1 3-alpha-hydroxysteroid dehydrogenase [Rhizobacter sp. Root1221]
MNFQNQVVVVTGSSSGIGAETARCLRSQGAKVIGIDRHPPALTLDAFVQADLSEVATIDAAVAQLPVRIDHLCNVAGVPGTADGATVARVNYLGLRHLTQRVLGRMPAGGSVVNVASILGHEWPQRAAMHKALAACESFDAGLAWLAQNPVAHDTCYQYFKEALIVWSTLQSQRWFLDRGIRMNCVAPGPVMTPILGDFAAMLGAERVQRDAHRIKRPALADEVAPVIAFLCSDAARWVSGATVPVDGGMASTYL